MTNNSLFLLLITLSMPWFVFFPFSFLWPAWCVVPDSCCVLQHPAKIEVLCIWKEPVVLSGRASKFSLLVRCVSDTTTQLVRFYTDHCVVVHWLQRLLQQGDGLRQNTQHFYFCRSTLQQFSTTHRLRNRKSGAKRKEKILDIVKIKGPVFKAVYFNRSFVF